jgi:hypothetical protein
MSVACDFLCLSKMLNNYIWRKKFTFDLNRLFLVNHRFSATWVSIIMYSPPISPILPFYIASLLTNLFVKTVRLLPWLEKTLTLQHFTIKQVIYIHAYLFTCISLLSHLKAIKIGTCSGDVL